MLLKLMRVYRWRLLSVVSIDEDEPCYLGTGVMYYGTWLFCYESYFGGVEMSVWLVSSLPYSILKRDRFVKPCLSDDCVVNSLFWPTNLSFSCVFCMVCNSELDIWPRTLPLTLRSLPVDAPVSWVIVLLTERDSANAADWACCCPSSWFARSST